MPADPLKDLETGGLTAAGEEIYAFAERAYPICRSITGDGVRETLRLLQDEIGDGAQLVVHEVPTGTQVFDWQVPKEWNVRGAWIDGPDGRVVNFADHNLHLLNYSVPFRGTLTLEELKPHLYSDPECPAAIPYRTSYYQERWGFCLPHEQLEALPDGDYEVVVDTTLEDGHLTYGEVVLPGESDDVVLLSAHVCHPSLANDNLSAVGVAAHLARRLATIPRRRYTYRIVFAPGTIGAIVWLAQNEEVAARVRHGLVLANLGDGGGASNSQKFAFHYKRSRQENAVIDRAVIKVLEDAAPGDSRGAFEVEDFSPFGYDERQYGSPGFDLPVGSLARTPWGRYPEYHSSGDNLDLIRPKHLGRSLHRLLEVVHLLEHDRTFRNLNPKCEPQLGSRGLYSTLGGGDAGRDRQLALLWVLNQSDGTNSLLDISERSGKPFRAILEAATALIKADLLEEVG